MAKECCNGFSQMPLEVLKLHLCAMTQNLFMNEKRLIALLKR